MQPVYPKIFSAFFQCLCPKCRQGKVFKFPLKKIAKFSATNEFCPQCGLRFEAEPGFFWGAMYVSYGLNVAIGVAAFIVSFVFLNSTITGSLMAIFASLILLYPFVIRLSRSIYINIFVSYDKRFDKVIPADQKAL